MKVEHLIFDLDSTLYPSGSLMEKGIMDRMMSFVADFFDVSLEEAALMRKERGIKFSTTFEWLRSEGLTDGEKYLAWVHPQNEADDLDFDENLRPFLQSIPIPKMILTNAPMEHAERVLKKLNVQDLFIGICDIRSVNFYGKPYPQAFETALKMCGGTIEDSIFIDDLKKYTDGYEALGGVSVLVGNNNGSSLSPDSAAVTKQNPSKPGKTFKINSIYNLAELLKIL